MPKSAAQTQIFL